MVGAFKIQQAFPCNHAPPSSSKVWEPDWQAKTTFYCWSELPSQTFGKRGTHPRAGREGIGKTLATADDDPSLSNKYLVLVGSWDWATDNLNS